MKSKNQKRKQNQNRFRNWLWRPINEKKLKRRLKQITAIWAIAAVLSTSFPVLADPPSTGAGGAAGGAASPSPSPSASVDPNASPDQNGTTQSNSSGGGPLSAPNENKRSAPDGYVYQTGGSLTQGGVYTAFKDRSGEAYKNALADTEKYTNDFYTKLKDFNSKYFQNALFGDNGKLYGINKITDHSNVTLDISTYAPMEYIGMLNDGFFGKSDFAAINTNISTNIASDSGNDSPSKQQYSTFDSDTGPVIKYKGTETAMKATGASFTVQQMKIDALSVEAASLKAQVMGTTIWHVEDDKAIRDKIASGSDYAGDFTSKLWKMKDLTTKTEGFNPKEIEYKDKATFTKLGLLSDIWGLGLPFLLCDNNQSGSMLDFEKKEPNFTYNKLQNMTSSGDAIKNKQIEQAKGQLWGLGPTYSALFGEYPIESKLGASINASAERSGSNLAKTETLINNTPTINSINTWAIKGDSDKKKRVTALNAHSLAYALGDSSVFDKLVTGDAKAIWDGIGIVGTEKFEEKIKNNHKYEPETAYQDFCAYWGDGQDYKNQDVGKRRALLGGVDEAEDGIDSLDNYFSTLLSIVDFQTFQTIMKTRYDVDVDDSTDGATIKEQLEKWQKSEQDLYTYALNDLIKTDAFYQKFGKEKYTDELIESVNESMEKINKLLSAAGLDQMQSEEQKSQQDQSTTQAITKGPLADWYEIKDDAITTNDDYNKIWAMTSALCPGQSNINEIKVNVSFMDEYLQDKYEKYASFKQPLFMVKNGGAIYTDLIQGTERQLEYVTLRDFIESSKNDEDIFLFVNTLTKEDIKNSGRTNVSVNSETTNGGGDPAIDSGFSTTTAPGTSIDNSGGNTGGTDPNGGGDTTQTQTSTEVNVELPNVNASMTTNNARFFGPVYGSSASAAYSDIYHSNASILDPDNEETIIFDENSVLSAANSTLRSAALYNSATKTVRNEDGSDSESEMALNGKDVASYTTQRITPESLYMNNMIANNIIEEGLITQSSMEIDMDSPLYMDFFGNIFSQSGFLVVPAAANATRYKDLQEYYIVNSAFINSYPDFKYNKKEGLKLDGKDANKKAITIFGNANNMFDQDRNTDNDTGDTEGGNTTFKTWEIGRLKDNKSFKSKVKITIPRMVSFLDKGKRSENQKITGDAYNTDTYPDFPANSLVVNLMTGDNMIKTKEKFLWIFTKDDYTTFDYKNSVPSITLSTENGTGTAVLRQIPPNTSSYEAQAVYQLNYNLINNNQETDKKTHVTTDTSIGISAAVMAGSQGTEIYDDFSFDLTGIDAEDATKKLLGGFAEGMYTQFVAQGEFNLLTFFPSLGKFDSLKNFTVYLMPLLVIILGIICIILFISLATLRTRESTLSPGDLIMAIVCVVLAMVFVFYGIVPTRDLIFKKPAEAMTEGDNMLMIAYEQELANKQESLTYFTQNKVKPTDFESKVSLRIDKLTAEEAKAYREAQDRLEVKLPFYSASYDNSRMYIANGMYIQGLEVKIDADTLFNGSNITASFREGKNMTYEHNVTEQAQGLAAYTNYYSFIDSIVNTLNAYSGATSDTYKYINYSNGRRKTTSRVANYINSLFYIAPDTLVPALEKYRQVYEQGDYSIGDIYNNTGARDVGELVEVSLNNGDSYVLDSESMNAYMYLGEEMGWSFEDWLGITKMHYRSVNNYPFDEKFKPNVQSARWYPNFDKIKSDDDYMAKVLRVNENTKQFVINELMPLQDTLSDETLIKLIALKATMEYNKEFSNVCSKNLYPQALNSDKANNDYLIKSAIINRADLFEGNSSCLALYVKEKSDIVGLILFIILLVLKLIIYYLKYPLVIILIGTMIAMFYAFIFKKYREQKVFIRVFGFVLASLLLQYYDIVGYKLCHVLTAHCNTAWLLAINILVSVIGLWLRIVFLTNALSMIQTTMAQSPNVPNWMLTKGGKKERNDYIQDLSNYLTNRNSNSIPVNASVIIDDDEYVDDDDLGLDVSNLIQAADHLERKPDNYNIEYYDVDNYIDQNDSNY